MATSDRGPETGERGRLIHDYFFDPLFRTACNSTFAIGAAVVPPKPCWFSSVTATATCGWSAGAKQMNQVVLMPLLPVSAVPVLPATEMPGIWAAPPVPSLTAATIIDVISLAVCGDMARRSFCGW